MRPGLRLDPCQEPVSRSSGTLRNKGSRAILSRWRVSRHIAISGAHRPGGSAHRFPRMRRGHGSCAIASSFIRPPNTPPRLTFAAEARMRLVTLLRRGDAPMKSGLLPAEFGAGLLALLVSGTAFAAAPSKSDLDRIAQKLTTQAAGIKEAELVLIEGAPRDLELLQDLAVQVRKVGAFPLLQVGGDRLTRRLYDDVPEKFDAQEPKLGLRIAESFDAIIGLDDVDDPGNLKHVAPARQLARGTGGM